MRQENEESAELLATIQREHVPTKTWYNSSTSAAATSLREKYGSSYPSFWRDVVSWDGWKETRRLYLKSMNGIDETVKKEETCEINVRRKRRSRWASSTPTPVKAPTQSSSTEKQQLPPRKRKSRWARGCDEPPLSSLNNTTSNSQQNPPAGPTTVLDLLPSLPTNLNRSEGKQLKELQKKLREANERLENLEEKTNKIDALPLGHRDRSPSPPPVYGADGKRKNTRAIRWKERYTLQRQDTLEQIISLTTSKNSSNKTDPFSTSSANAVNSIAPSLFRRKRTRKIPIPVEQHPTYNFIGLIIGPRGRTQKEMEQKTGCKIAIRGRGSVKEGARGRRDGKMMDGDEDPLHVVVTGDNQAAVDAAADMVQQMLIVMDDDKNVHKQQQLRELALLNGTLKEEEYCGICAEKGHRAFECPKRFSGKKLIQVKCAICGDSSHPTRDCTQKNPANTTIGTIGDTEQNGKDKKQLDSDYMDFMNELEGKTGTLLPSPPLTTLLPPGGSSVGQSAPNIEGAGGICLKVPSGVDRAIPDTSAGPLSTSSSVITTISSRMVSKSELEAADGMSSHGGSINGPPKPALSSLPPALPPHTTATAITPLADSGGGRGFPPPGLPSHRPSTVTVAVTPLNGTSALPPATTIVPSTAFPMVGVLSSPPIITCATKAVITAAATTNSSSTSSSISILPPPPAPPSQYGQQQRQPYGLLYRQTAVYPQPLPPHHHNLQQQQGDNNQVTGWDYRNYYSGNSGHDANGNDPGATGFNWWEA